MRFRRMTQQSLDGLITTINNPRAGHLSMWISIGEKKYQITCSIAGNDFLILEHEQEVDFSDIWKDQ